MKLKDIPELHRGIGNASPLSPLDDHCLSHCFAILVMIIDEPWWAEAAPTAASGHHHFDR